MNMKGIVLIFFVVIGMTVLGSSIFMSQTYKVNSEDAFKSAAPVEITQIKEASTDASKLRAMLKGSIYESGEEVTVYGACFDGWGYLIPGSNATFSSWYPNGTQWHNESPMTSIAGSGRFRIQMNMSDTMGTYLTQIRCNYEGDFALAFGEWQNPDWVKRIKDTQDSVINLTALTTSQYNNISLQIDNFWNETQINFSQVLIAIGEIDVTENLARDITELYNMVHSIDTNFWVIDDQAPWYSFGSDMFNFQAVDMLSPFDIFAVSEDGYAVYWDGETWQVQANYSDVAWYGVSVLPASTPYAWYVGQNTTSNTSVYSVNGGTPTTLNGSTGAVYYDVKLFPNPNSPSSNYYGYLIEDDGKIWYSSDNGVTYTNVYNFTCTDDAGRISQIIANTDLGVTTGYRVAFTMCDELVYYNGTGYATYSAANQNFRDVEVVYENEVYLISKDNVTDELKVWYFDGTALSEVYAANDTTIEPRGIAGASPRDIWIVTNNPSIYYHYDGFAWEYSNYPYSGAVGTVITFTNGTIPGLFDVYVFDAKNAYAVGTDGLIMKYYSMFDIRFDEVIADLNNLSYIYDLLVTLNSSVYDITEIVLYINDTTVSINNTVNDIVVDLAAMNLTVVNISGELYDVELTVNNINTTVNQISSDVINMNSTIVNILGGMNTTIIDIQNTVNAINLSLDNLTSIVLSMNASAYSWYVDLSNKIDLLNTTVNVRFDQVIANITYMQLYLNTTIYPTLTTILTRLGVIETNVNATLQIANETLIIVNETATDVDELVNKSRRIHAWITV